MGLAEREIIIYIEGFLRYLGLRQKTDVDIYYDFPDWVTCVVGIDGIFSEQDVCIFRMSRNGNSIYHKIRKLKGFGKNRRIMYYE